MAGHFSFFKSGIKNKKNKIDISLQGALKKIKNDYEKEITNLRKATDPSVQKILKENLDYFTFSGTFNERKIEGLIEHSGYICIDLDLNGEYKLKDFAKQLDLSLKEAKDNYPKGIIIQEYNLETIKYLISLDKFTLACFVSPSGTGIKIICKINGENHAESFLYLEKYYFEKYGIFIDPSGKDVSRACFISWEPYLHFNPDAEIVIVDVPQAAPSLVPMPEKYKIDTDSGEVITITGMEDWSRDKKKSFDRAKQVVQRIVDGQVDITSQYDDWLKIGLSLAVFGDLGRDLYHKVSQFNPEYKERSCNYKFDDFLKNGKFDTPGKFFSICKEYNIDIRAVRTEQPAAAEGAFGREFHDMSFELPKDCDLTEELKSHTFQYSFIEHNSRYFYASFDNNRRQVSFYSISNFIIRPLFLVMSKADAKRIIEIENIYGVKKVIDIPTKAFVSLTDFNCFVESQGNFLFEGDRNKFNKIKSKLYDLSRNAEEVKTLGYHRDGFYCFVNGIYNPAVKELDADGHEVIRPKFQATDDHGVIEFNGKNYFIPALSSIYKDEEDDFEAQKKFVFIRNKLKYKEWAADFCKVHKENGKIGMVYYITSLFRDLIYSRFKFFPHLFLFGPPGSGKSLMGWSISYMFGEAQMAFNLNGGTKVAFHKKFAMFRNAVVWFDEYNNAIDYSRVQALKAAYDGTGHEKSEMTTANRTKTTPVNSGCIISGQELPIADNALFKRTILLQYAQTEYNDQEAKDYSSFREVSQKGLSHITGHISTLRNIVEEKFYPEFEKTLKEYKDILEKESNIEERIIQNMVILVTMFRILEPRLGFPFSAEEFKHITLENITHQNSMIANAKETNMFWDLVEFMIDKAEIKEGVDFKINVLSTLKVQDGRNEDKELHFTSGNMQIGKQILYLRLSKIHPLYLESHRRQYNKNGLDKGSLMHYLTNNKAFLGNIKSTRFDNSNSSAFAFDYDYLANEGINMQRGDPDAAINPLLPSVPVGQPNSQKKDDDSPF